MGVVDVFVKGVFINGRIFLEKVGEKCKGWEKSVMCLRGCVYVVS